MSEALSFVTAPDGVRVAVEAVGPTDAPTLVFVHGFAQSRQIWRPVLEGPLREDHRLVSFDLRGHGDSDAARDAPGAPEGLGADLTAVVRSLGGVQPIVVAWSYGGVVLGEYLRAGGPPLAGALLVAAAVKVGRAAKAFFGPTMLGDVRALLAEDRATYEHAARRFVAGCAASPPPADLQERAVAEMLRVDAATRRAMMTREADYTDDLARSGLPLRALHGQRDSVVLPAMSDSLVGVVPDFQVTRLEAVGHVPWVEAPEAFEAAVRAHVQGCARVR